MLSCPAMCGGSVRNLWFVRLQVKADFLAGPERPATPRGSQSAKVTASGGKAAACNTVAVPGAHDAQPLYKESGGMSRQGSLSCAAALQGCAQHRAG